MKYLNESLSLNRTLKLILIFSLMAETCAIIIWSWTWSTLIWLIVFTDQSHGLHFLLSD